MDSSMASRRRTVLDEYTLWVLVERPLRRLRVDSLFLRGIVFVLLLPGGMWEKMSVEFNIFASRVRLAVSVGASRMLCCRGEGRGSG